MSDSQLVQRPQSVKDYLALPSYRDRFHEVMGKRANQFMAAIVASSQLPGLKDAEPRSIIAAAMVAATLDLPVNPTLGQAHIVAYQGVAQFQVGYKGLIQLALRSGQYKRLNAGPVSEEVFSGFDTVGEPILDFRKNDPLAEAAGYYCAFETLNGFIKIVYWSRQQAQAHAMRFSKAYAKGYSTPWKSDFDSMATKTVIKAALGKWGLLSIEMQKAVVHDQGAQEDVDAEVKFVDQTDATESSGAVLEPDPKSTKGAAGAVNAAKNVTPAADPLPEGAAPVDVTPPAEERAPARQRRGQAPKPETTATPPAENPAPAATEPKAAEKVVEPLPPGAAPVPDKPRVFLQDGERVTVEVEVVDLITGNSKVGNEMVPTVQADVRGGFTGQVRHSRGASLNAAGIAVENPPWAKGANLRLELVGKKSTSTTGPNVGKVLVWVKSVSAVEGAQGQIPVEEA